MDSATGASVYLKDYTVPEFLIPEVELDISLFEDDAVVRANAGVGPARHLRPRRTGRMVSETGPAKWPSDVPRLSGTQAGAR
jgi:hypothetical protein